MTSSQAIVERLKEFSHNQPNSEWSELDPDTENLIKGNPFALLIAVAFDRGMPWQKAWQIPAEIHQKGVLDPKLLASMSKAELVELLNSLPFLPRYGAQQGAKTLSEAARHLSPEFPAALDWPAWRIAQIWCHPKEPECAPCPLTRVCAKRM